MKITRKIRNEAIMICELAGNDRVELATYERCRWAIFATFESLSLADAAFDAVSTSPGAHTMGFCNNDLEAAALLRDGWSPGDPVRRLP